MTLYVAEFEPPDLTGRNKLIPPGTTYSSLEVGRLLFRLVEGDGYLGAHVDPFQPWYSLIDYSTPARAGFCQNMIAELARTRLSHDIVIYGVPGSFTLPIIDYAKIHQAKDYGAAITWHPNTGNSWNPIDKFTGSGSDPLCIWLDVDDCDGNGRIVRNEYNSGDIDQPIEMTLFNALSIAYHYVRRSGVGKTLMLKALKDENGARRQRSLPLRSETVSDGECKSKKAKKSVTSLDDVCLIASAAFGTPEAAEVRDLRQFRDNVLRPSAVGWRFFEHFFADYYRFSPDVAAAMMADRRLANLIHAVAVHPLLTIWTLCRDLVGGCGGDVLSGLLRQSFAESAARCAGFGGTRIDPWQVLDKLKVIRNPQTSLPESARTSLAYRDDDPLSIFDEIGVLVRCRVMCFDLLDWALFEPLEIYWRLLSDNAAAERNSSELKEALVSAIELWVVHLPLPADCLSHDVEVLAMQLRELGERVLISPGIRRAFARSLLANRDLNSFGTLERALRAASFLDPPVSR